jgi:hypothetical protein
VVCVVLLSASLCLGSGLNDFELDLGDGYKLVRCNPASSSICDSNGTVLCPGADDRDVGPVVGYIVTQEHIIAKAWGRPLQVHFEGDKHDRPVSSHEFFYIIAKGPNQVVGPLTGQDFAKRPEVVELKPLDWKTPEDPRPQPAPPALWVVFAAVLAARYWWVSVPAILGAVILIVHVRKARGRKA